MSLWDSGAAFWDNSPSGESVALWDSGLLWDSGAFWDYSELNEKSLFTIIGPLFQGRFYPDVAPDNATLPYATYSQVGGESITFMEGASTVRKNARIQFNVWAKTRLEAIQIIRSLENILVQSPLYGVAEGAAIAQYDDVTHFRGMHQDFSFWFN